MRKILLALAAAALLPLLPAGAAQALSITPNPVNQTRGSLDADVYLVSIAGDTLTLQVSVNAGSLVGLDVSLLSDGGSGVSLISSAGSNAGTGDVGATVVNVLTEAQYTFSAAIGAGQTSDELVIQYDMPLQAGWSGSLGLDDGAIVGSSFSIVAVPEPALGLLLGAALLGAGALRRMR